ncbi:pre-tape measure protein [Xanthomonas phage FoX4]|uniref:Pre-tape measure protein n=1 Tax=Xanthomonas phage FoX4 TaxID=2723900 RepID=A0A858WLF9_9CAUD|nr:tail length tape measure protein [Xanthomonas phage FoX4]QJI52981.1 pre-tape measure protein [Xanthomonas phage FoX4]
MAISDYTPETREIQIVGKTSFSVKGVSLHELSPLIRVHLPDLEQLFDIFENLAEREKQNIPLVAGRVIAQAPGFAANLIAMCAGEPEAAPKVQQMPFPTQVQALAAISELTFTEVGGVKKGLEILASLISKKGLSWWMTEGKKMAQKVNPKPQ